MCTNTPSTLLWFRAIGTMYVLGTLALMFLWIASNDGIYAQHSQILSIQFIYSGIIMGIWMSVMSYEENTVKTTKLMISILLGGLAAMIANVLFAIWALDILSSKCQDPSAYGCVYEKICQTEQAYLIAAIVFVAYLTIVDILVIIMSYLVLGKTYPSVTQQVKYASE